MDWELRATRAERAAESLAGALVVCAAIAGWSIGGWWGFGVFLAFAFVADGGRIKT